MFVWVLNTPLKLNSQKGSTFDITKIKKKQKTLLFRFWKDRKDFHQVIMFSSITKTYISREFIFHTN